MNKEERKHQEDLLRLKSLRPIDDDFMRAMLKENIPLTQMILRVIINKPDPIITSCETQADMKRVTGARSICLDAYGTDSTGKKYDLEIQRADKGAAPRRARFHSSVMDVENLDAGQDFSELPDTYTIFITENDFFRDGKPLHLIRKTDCMTGEFFGDGACILYVNGEYNGDDELGRLMHDFNCTDAAEMYHPLMAERTRYLKETQEGVTIMCRAIEELANERAKEATKEALSGVAEKLLLSGKETIEEIARISDLTVEEVERIRQKMKDC